MKNVFPVRTALKSTKKGGVAVTTMLTLDYTGVDVGDGTLIAQAEKGIVIDWQAERRRAGTAIPGTATINVKEFLQKGRTRSMGPVTADTAKASVLALTPAEQKALLDTLRAEMAEREKAEAAKAKAEADAAKAAAKPSGKKPSPSAKPTGTEVKSGDGQSAQT